MSVKSSTIWLLFEKIIVLGISFIVTALLARHLLPSVFGQYNYLISIVTLLGPITAFGLNSIITREVINRKNDTHVILGSALSIRISISLVLFISMCFLYKYFLDEAYKYEFYVLLIANLFTSFGVFEFWVNAEMLNALAAKVRTAIRLTGSLLKLIGIYYDADLTYFIIVFSVELSLLSLSMYLLYFRKKKSLSDLSFSTNETLLLVKQSWWLLLSGIAAVIYLKIDQVMLGLLAGDTAVGIYSVASRLSEVWYFIPAAIVTSYFPSLLDKKSKSSVLYHHSLQKLCDILFLIALVVALVMTLLSSQIIEIAFGSAYSQSAGVLVVHIWAGLFIFMRTLVSKWILAEDLLKYSLISQLSGAVINVLTNYLLIPIYGPIGAAIATLISYAFASYFILIFFKKTRPIAIVMTKSFFLPMRFLIRNKIQS